MSESEPRLVAPISPAFIDSAKKKAASFGNHFVYPYHLLLACLEDPEQKVTLSRLFNRFGMTTQDVISAVDCMIPKLDVIQEATLIRLGFGAQGVMDDAEEEAILDVSSQVTPFHVFRSLLRENDGFTTSVLETCGIDVLDINSDLDWEW
jgi:ATP-dependent Clp protease ATP-binding subunit ClpA